MSERSPLRIRAYQQGDEAALMDGFNAAFKLTRGVDYWRWKYVHDGKAMAWLCEDAAHKVLSQIAVHPVTWQCGTEQWRVGHAGDVFTLPRPEAVHGRAMLRTLSGFHREQRETNTLKLLFGFPSDVLRALHNTQTDLLGPVQAIRLWRHSSLQEIPAPQERLICGLPSPAEADALWRRCAPRYALSCVRDVKWLSWRFEQRPDVDNYEYVHVRDDSDGVCAWAVLRAQQGALWLVDLLWDGRDPQHLVSLLQHARHLAQRRACQHTALWLEGDAQAIAVLESAGWQDHSHSHPTKLFMHGYDATLDYGWIRQALYITKADSDLI